MKVSDLFVGATVRPVEMGIVHPDMRVVSIYSDTVYCMVDPEQGDPFEYRISDVQPVPLTVDALLQLEFKRSGSVAWRRIFGAFEVLITPPRSAAGFRVSVYYKSRYTLVYRDIISSVHELERILLRFGDSRDK